jgi:hypothetical protein
LLTGRSCVVGRRRCGGTARQPYQQERRQDPNCQAARVQEIGLVASCIACGCLAVWHSLAAGCLATVCRFAIRCRQQSSAGLCMQDLSTGRQGRHVMRLPLCSLCVAARLVTTVLRIVSLKWCFICRDQEVTWVHAVTFSTVPHMLRCTTVM